MNKIAVIGDSHTNFFGGGELLLFLPIVDQNKQKIGIDKGAVEAIDNFTLFHLGSALAYNLINYSTTNRALEKIKLLLNSNIISSGQPILCCFGEIDLRVHVLRQADKQHVGYKKVVDDVLKNYLEFLINLSRDHKVYVWGPVPSQKDGSVINPEFPYYGTEADRNRATEYFNEKLRELCVKHGITFISIFKYLIDEDYKTRSEYIADGCHLSQKAWAFAYDELKAAGIDVKFSPRWINLSINSSVVCGIRSLSNETSATAYDHSDEIQYVDRIRKSLRVMDVTSKNFIRVGSVNSGGYVMVNDFSKVNTIYDLTLNKNFDWDVAMISNKFAGGGHLYADKFQLPISAADISELMRHDLKISNFYATLLGSRYMLAEIINQNGHGADRNMILKITLRGAAYDALHTISTETLQQFRQIIIVYHALLQPRLENVIRFALDKINATHQLVHVHANNTAAFTIKGGKVLPDVLECTYLRRDCGKFVRSQRFFPTPLDAPNDPSRPDINLGYWGDIT